MVREEFWLKLEEALGENYEKLEEIANRIVKFIESKAVKEVVVFASMIVIAVVLSYRYGFITAVFVSLILIYLYAKGLADAKLMLLLMIAAVINAALKGINVAESILDVVYLSILAVIVFEYKEIFKKFVQEITTVDKTFYTLLIIVGSLLVIFEKGIGGFIRDLITILIAVSVYDKIKSKIKEKIR